MSKLSKALNLDKHPGTLHAVNDIGRIALELAAPQIQKAVEDACGKAGLQKDTADAIVADVMAEL